MLRKAFCAALTVALLVCCSGFASAQASPARPQLRFNDDGGFRIMQITDTHYTDQYALKCSMGIRFIEKALDKYKPDLVVFTGDNIKGYFDVATPRTVKKAIDLLIAPVADRSIPFAVVFGNHDYQSGVTEKQQLAIYRSYPTCLAENGFSVLTRHGNYNLTVKSSDGARDVLNLWLVDSGTKTVMEEDAALYKSQIEWYQKTQAELKAKNGGASIPALWFQHIPVQEVYSLFTEVEQGTPGAVAGNSSFASKWYVLNSGMASGDLLSGPGTAQKNTGEYAAWVESGDVIGAFFGHDHMNDFVGTTQDGIVLASCKATGFVSRGDGAKRGVRIIDLKQDDVRNFKTYSVYYSELSDEAYPLEKVQYDTETRLADLRTNLLDELWQLFVSLGYYLFFL